MTRHLPCPVCGKPDWCLRRPDGSAAICARIPSAKQVGTKGAGWLHLLDDGPFDPKHPGRAFRLARSKPRADFAARASACIQALPEEGLESLARSLGLSARSLERLAVGWEGENRCYSFPMQDEHENIIGIRLRRPAGGKFAVAGSQAGLFVPSNLGPVKHLFIAEGPTDCAALLDLDLPAVGRPSCWGGVPLLVDLARRLRPSAVAIVADSDAPGQRGAAALAQVLVLQVASVRIITPPPGFKDVRDWKSHGATATDLERAAAAAEPRSMRFRISLEARNG